MGRHAKHNAHRGGRKLGCSGQPVCMEDQFNDVVVEEVLIHTVTDGKELDNAVAGEPLTQQGEVDGDDVE